MSQTQIAVEPGRSVPPQLEPKQAGSMDPLATLLFFMSFLAVLALRR